MAGAHTPHKYDRPNSSPAACVRCGVMVLWRKSTYQYSADGGVTWSPKRPSCHEEIDGFALRTLASNLAIGAALCHAHDLGEAYGYDAERYFELLDDDVDMWRPGCGRPPHALRPAISEET